MRLFKRKYLFTAAGIEISDLRIAFHIKKTLEKEPNTGEIKLYNLGFASRQNLTRKGLNLKLEAGYEGNTATLFNGDLRVAEHIREDADWITTLSCGEGEDVYRFSRFNKSYKGKTDAETVLTELIGAAQFSKGNLTQAMAFAKTLPGKTTHENGFVAQGRLSNSISKLTDAAGINWCLTNGSFRFSYRGEEIGQNIALEITPQSGMIGSPELSSPNHVDNLNKPASRKPKAKNKNKTIAVRILLDATLIPGHVVLIRHQGTTYEAVITSLEHSGDTHGDEWFTDLECVIRSPL